jgi:hypothetical protein
MSTEQFETGIRKTRGMAQRSLDLIDVMKAEAKAAKPITGRGVGYKLFVRGLIPSMGNADMQRVYRLLREARERGIIPWSWIVDETRELERVATWDNPAEYAEATVRDYRRDYWNQQPVRVEVWSEKGTVRGVLAPVLNDYAVGFRVAHGFGSATMTHDASTDDDGRPLIILYVGDWDPSGLCMSEHDLPRRFEKYGGDHIDPRRIALTEKHLASLPSFPAAEKKSDPRYKWFVQNYGTECWELDALDPNKLRTLVKDAIRKEVDWDAWERCGIVEDAERDSIEEVLRGWVRGRKGKRI